MTSQCTVSAERRIALRGGAGRVARAGWRAWRVGPVENSRCADSRSNEYAAIERVKVKNAELRRTHAVRACARPACLPATPATEHGARFCLRFRLLRRVPVAARQHAAATRQRVRTYCIASLQFYVRGYVCTHVSAHAGALAPVSR